MPQTPLLSELPLVRTSERKKFKQCQWAWWQSYREGWKQNLFTPDALWFGTGMHLAFAHYYIPGTKRGVDPRETWSEFCGDTIGFVKSNYGTDTQEMVDSRELGLIMLEGYLREYGSDEHWQVIQPEYPFHMLVGEPAVVRYVGTFDGVIRDLRDGKVKLLEHKTTGRTISTQHLALDDQAGSYWAVATSVLRADKKIGPNESLYGIEYNFLRKGTPDERPKDAQGFATNKPKKEDYIKALDGIGYWKPSTLTKQNMEGLAGIAADNNIAVLGERSKIQPAKLFLRTTIKRTAPERTKQLQRIVDEAEQMDLLRHGEIVPSKAPGDHCAWCEFKLACELDESGGNANDILEFAFHREDPYADHRDGVRRTSKFLPKAER